MSDKKTLVMDWASHKAAKHAVEKWHYSGVMPYGKCVKIGAWEDGRFIGVIIFSMGAGDSTNGKRFGLARNGEMIELVRVALRSHATPVTRMIAISVKMLKREFPKIRMLVSFADSSQGHHGGIYQGGNWVYTGETTTTEFVVHGKQMHLRSIYQKGWRQTIGWIRENIDPNAYRVKTDPKYRYLMGLDSEMVEHVQSLAKPYPKREKQAMAGDQPAQRRGSTDHHAPIV